MQKAFTFLFVFLALAASAKAQGFVVFQRGHFPQQLAWRTFAYHNALARQQLWMLHEQRNAQLQAAAAYAHMQQQIQPQPYVPHAAQWQGYGVAQQERTEERIRDLKDQQQRIEARLNELHAMLLARQPSEPTPTPSVSREKMGALRSELELLRQALSDLKDELRKTSPNQ